MKKINCKGSTVVEMAYIMPVVLLCWMLIVIALFYYHDKSIIAGAAYESAVMGSELWAEETEYRSAKIEDYFRERLQGKLLFYKNVEVGILVDTDKVRVKAEASKYLMLLKVEEQAAITEPEKVVRDMLILEETVGDAIK